MGEMVHYDTYRRAIERAEDAERKLENDYCDDCIICVTHYQKSFKQERDILAKTVDELRVAIEDIRQEALNGICYCAIENGKCFRCRVKPFLTIRNETTTTKGT